MFLNKRILCVIAVYFAAFTIAISFTGSDAYANTRSPASVVSGSCKDAISFFIVRRPWKTMLAKAQYKFWTKHKRESRLPFSGLWRKFRNWRTRLYIRWNDDNMRPIFYTLQDDQSFPVTMKYLRSHTRMQELQDLSKGDVKRISKELLDDLAGRLEADQLAKLQKLLKQNAEKDANLRKLSGEFAEFIGGLSKNKQGQLKRVGIEEVTDLSEFTLEEASTLLNTRELKTLRRLTTAKEQIDDVTMDLMDLDTMIKELVESEKEILVESKRAVQAWMEQYAGYKKKLGDLVEEYTVNKYQIGVLKGYKKHKGRYPYTVTIELKQNGQTRLITKEIEDELAILREIDILQDRNLEIMGSWSKGIGEIDKLQHEQALLNKRLQHLKDEMTDIVVTVEGRGEEVLPALRREHDKIKKLLKKRDLEPSVASSIKVEKQELGAEYDQLFSNWTDFKKKMSEQIKTTSKKVLDSLSPREKEKLGINKVGRWASVFKYGRFALLGTSLGGGGIAGVGMMLWRVYWLGEDDRYKCAHQESREEFRQCLKKYIMDHYPIMYRRSMEDPSYRPFNISKLTDAEIEKIEDEEKKKYIKDIKGIIWAHFEYIAEIEGRSITEKDIFEGIDKLIKAEEKRRNRDENEIIPEDPDPERPGGVFNPPPEEEEEDDDDSDDDDNEIDDETLDDIFGENDDDDNNNEEDDDDDEDFYDFGD